MTEPITVLLADDHHLVRTGFRRLLEDEPDIRVVGEASNGMEAVNLAEHHQPRVVVMDMAMPEMDGTQATLEIRRRVPEAAILALSMYSDPRYIRNALRAGAQGYLLKNAIDNDLVEAVRAVARGERYLGPNVKAPSEEPDDPLARLTQRELQILQLIAQAKPNKEIAHILNLSVNTVNVHRTNLMNALNLHSTAELVLFAVKRGLAALPE